MSTGHELNSIVYMFEIFQTKLYFYNWKCTNTEQAEPGKQRYESCLLKTVFLTFLKLKTAKNKSSA